MKRIASYLIALAAMAFTFTSCEDVPSPFGEIIKPSGEEKVVIEPTGSGTEKDPYNVAAVLEYVSGLVASEDSPIDVYVQGIVTNVTEAYGTQYGNATFEMSDDENGSNKFTFYRGLYFDNKKYSNASDPGVSVGDKVVICGRVMNYKGNTPETSQGKAWLVSVNGKGGSGSGGGDTPTPGGAKGTGTQADPFNVAAAIAKCKETGQTETADIYYVKGLVNADYTVDNFKNATFDMVDTEGASEKFTAYRVFGPDGAKLKEGYKIPKGATVLISGKLVNFKGNTPETAQNSGTLISVNGNAPELDGQGGGGGGSGTDVGEGDGTEAKPYNVTAAIAKAEQTGVYVKGFIVGFVDGQAYDTGATFSSAATGKTNVLIAASVSETDPAKCMPVQLPSGAIREGLNLQDNAGNYKKEVTLYGDIATYFKVPGIKNTSYALIDGNAIGTKPGEGGGGSGGGGGTASGTGTLDNPLTATQVYDIVAAMDKDKTSSEDYYVKGKICSIKYEFSTDYGTATFNISDDGSTGNKEFTVYSTYYHADGQKWTANDTQIKKGDEVIICGKVINYGGNTPEFASKKSYVVTINGK